MVYLLGGRRLRPRVVGPDSMVLETSFGPI